MSSSSTIVSLLGADPTAYEAHPLHTGPGAYNETNCYADILIELLHARGDEPLAAFGSVVRLDFEGDQWTFFKPHPADLEELLGVDIHEMQPYRPLPVQAAEQIAHGRTIIVELDAFHLPDTASTSYGREHVKTSVVIEAIDVAGQRMHYFHNGGLYALDGDDYRAVFRVADGWAGEVLPPYTELVRFDDSARLTGAALRDAARERFTGHLARRPARNPFTAFGAQLAAELPTLIEGDLAAYHDYAFATVRMAGAGFSILAAQVAWLFDDDTGEIGAALERIVEACKALSFKLARRRAFDPQPALDAMSADWDAAMRGLDALVAA